MKLDDKQMDKLHKDIKEKEENFKLIEKYWKMDDLRIA
jgi:hypothetical protein